MEKYDQLAESLTNLLTKLITVIEPRQIEIIQDHEDEIFEAIKDCIESFNAHKNI